METSRVTLVGISRHTPLLQKHRRGQSVRGGGEMHETDAARALRMFASIGS
jgi:hypothetical protein